MKGLKMKKMFFLMLFLCFCVLFSPASLWAEKFLEAPLVPGGKTVQKTKSKMEMVSRLSHRDVMRFYKEALNGDKDIKFREWKNDTYIEDDGNRPWHSITISKLYDKGTTIVITKDNWTWIIGTLVLRYIGVFVVLLFLLLGISVSGAIISKSVKKMEAKKQ